MKKISILLSTYNGEKYLKEQLDSLQNQTYKCFKVIARDDGSSDNTIEILKSYDVILLETTENLGAKESFAELLSYAVVNGESDYFMFCDQDDVWENDKVEKTLAKMKKMEQEFRNIPLLVHTDLKVVDEHLQTVSSSMWAYEHIEPSKNSLNRLLIHNTITGCTVMINRHLANKCLPISSDCIMHDWWIGLVASSFGKIDYINEATIKYRQHCDNDTGAKRYSYKKIFYRVWDIFFGKESHISHLKKNIIQAKFFLESFDDELKSDEKNMLKDFTTIKDKSYLKRVYILFKHNLFKYGFLRNLGLLLKI